MYLMYSFFHRFTTFLSTYLWGSSTVIYIYIQLQHTTFSRFVYVQRTTRSLAGWSRKPSWSKHFLRIQGPPGCPRVSAGDSWCLLPWGVALEFCRPSSYGILWEESQLLGDGTLCERRVEIRLNDGECWMHHVPHIFRWICFLLIETRDHLPEHYCLPQKLQLHAGKPRHGWHGQQIWQFIQKWWIHGFHPPYCLCICFSVMETYGKATTQGMIKESFSYINNSLNPLFSCSSNPKCC